MQLSNEAIISIIGVVATLAAAYAYVLKRRADVALMKAREREQEAKTEAQIQEALAAQAGRLIEIIGTDLKEVSRTVKESVEAQGRTIDKLLERLEKKQDDLGDIQSNFTTYLQWINEREKQVDEGLGKLTAVLIGIQEAQEEMRSEMDRAAERVVENSIAQRRQLEQSRRQEFLTFADEFATAFVAQQKAKTLDHNLFIIPTPNHPGWTYRFATPTVHTITFYNAPWIDSTTPIDGVEIGSEGELVHVIENYVFGWHVIAKTKNGQDSPGMGYVRAHSVKLTEIEGKIMEPPATA